MVLKTSEIAMVLKTSEAAMVLTVANQTFCRPPKRPVLTRGTSPENQTSEN